MRIPQGALGSTLGLRGPGEYPRLWEPLTPVAPRGADAICAGAKVCIDLQNACRRALRDAQTDPEAELEADEPPAATAPAPAMEAAAAQALPAAVAPAATTPAAEAEAVPAARAPEEGEAPPCKRPRGAKGPVQPRKSHNAWRCGMCKPIFDVLPGILLPDPNVPCGMHSYRRRLQLDIPPTLPGVPSGVTHVTLEVLLRQHAIRIYAPAHASPKQLRMHDITVESAAAAFQGALLACLGCSADVGPLMGQAIAEHAQAE